MKGCFHGAHVCLQNEHPSLAGTSSTEKDAWKKKQIGKDEMGGPLNTYAGLDIAAGGNKKIRVKKKSEAQERYRDCITQRCVLCCILSVWTTSAHLFGYLTRIII